MSRLFHSLLLLKCQLHRTSAGPACPISLRGTGILRARLPQEIHTPKAERAGLLKFGKPLGRVIDRLIQIVTPGTFHRWVRQKNLRYNPNKPGRPRKRLVLRELVRKIARETRMGYRRILGELRRLGRAY